MNIAIMSDSHDNWNNLKKAVETANKENCKYLLFAGDLIAPTGVSILEAFDGKVKYVWGNNEAEKMGITRKLDASKNIELCGNSYEETIDGIKIFMNHYPRFSELATKSGEFDLCVHGHTHDYRQETIGSTILVNPGEVHGYSSGEATFIIFDTADKSVRKISI